ncbi:MAG: sulfatase-like hydrolase/transferase, partial [Atopobiaceae bacterium]|nr:sulfatase-like hydrolase/transferase [Atopobiaceae bacterium]
MTNAAPTALVCILCILTIVWLVSAIVHDRGIRDMRPYRLVPYWEEPGLGNRGLVIRCSVLIAILVLNMVLTIAGAIVVGVYSCIVLCFLCVIAARGDADVERFGAYIANRLSTRLGRAAVVAVVVVLEFFALELPSNPEYYKMLAHPLTLAAEAVIIAFVTLVLWFAFQRRRMGLVVSATVFCLLGIAEYFVAYFKHMPILPSDLMALSTAAAVSSSYKYVLDERCLLSIATIFCASALGRAYERNDVFRAKTFALNLGSAGAFAFMLVLVLTRINFLSAFHMQVRAWRPLDDYRLYGFIPSFTAGVQAVFVAPPEDYNKESAEQTMLAYAQEWDETEGASTDRARAARQFENLQPSVIVVMNETFADLSIYDNLGTNSFGPQFFNRLDDYLMKGTLYVSAFGGGTCNTEFEFLTGHTINYMGASVYPYTLYNMDGVDNLAAQFAAMGYETSAMHPNLPTNWDRDVVYEQFGFERFYSLADFEGAETLRGFVTDAATYDLCLDILNSSDEPQFIFDVTMQNHSGYKKGTLP